ncbi:MAG TPA: hypothetical protein VH308_05365 [Terracidiphilus sp.]|nr:hypothetical protein [Terracidiphilus sp.]
MPNSIVVDPKGEESEFQGPVSTYEVFQPKESPSDGRFVAAEIDGPAEDGQVWDHPTAAIKAPTSRTAADRKKSPEDAKAAANRTKLYAAVGVGLGILAAGIGAFFIHLPKADGSYDFGSVNVNVNGLKGHLITNWGDQLDYKLTVEPSATIQQAAFQSAVANPPHPLSIDLQLKDAKGEVLCDTPVLLKFDPMKINSKTTTQADPNSKKFDEVSADREQVAIAINNARLLGEEVTREHGKDIFQNNVGTDGQIESISAQGVMPCTKSQYQSTASWGFTSNFPVVAPAVGSHKPGSGLDGDLSAYGGTPDTGQDTSRAPVKVKRKIAALPVSHFSIEEDDAVVGYQTATGIIETRAGRSFQVENKDIVASEIKGIELPITIHYRCDQFGACAMAGVGSGIQRAWIER